MNPCTFCWKMIAYNANLLIWLILQVISLELSEPNKQKRIHVCSCLRTLKNTEYMCLLIVNTKIYKNHFFPLTDKHQNNSFYVNQIPWEMCSIDLFPDFLSITHQLLMVVVKATWFVILLYILLWVWIGL